MAPVWQIIPWQVFRLLASSWQYGRVVLQPNFGISNIDIWNTIDISWSPKHSVILYVFQPKYLKFFNILKFCLIQMSLRKLGFTVSILINYINKSKLKLWKWKLSLWFTLIQLTTRENIHICLRYLFCFKSQEYKITKVELLY